MMRKIGNFFTAEEGQGMVEYGLIVGLIAIIVIAVMVALGPQIVGIFESAIEDDLAEGRQQLEDALGEDEGDTD